MPPDDSITASAVPGDGSASQLGDTIPRRHDLDALRAIAMLLGIALHGALSFVPLPGNGWAVQDVRQSETFGILVGFVHGFRMPLFFLISGFFTAMLWRKRGLRALMWQRMTRIGLPLLLGLVTIVPLVWVAIIGAGIYQSRAAETAVPNLWSAARSGDLEALRAELDGHAALNQLDPNFGATPLMMAVRNGQAEAVELLLAGGADVNARNRDGTTPLHAAALFGRDELFQRLMRGGADPTLRDRRGRTAIDALDVSWGRTMILAGMSQSNVDQTSVYQGREAIARSLAMTSSSEEAAVSSAGDPPAAETIPAIRQSERTAGISALLIFLSLFPFFHHLWFLWFLCWLVAAFAIYAVVNDRVSWRPPSWLVVSPARYVWLIPLTFVPQAMMGMFGASFGPDTSTGLLPLPRILLYYAIFFFFGAIYFDCEDRQARLGRRWYVTLPLAILFVFPLGYEMSTGAWGFSNGWLQWQFYYPVAIFLQAAYVWLMAFGLMGAFRYVYSSESKTMRYVSDSSYWLYLAHLPLILVFQAVVRSWEVPAAIKFTLVCTLATAMLLASYQAFVRYTLIGRLLNGPRTRPQVIPEAELVSVSEAVN